jgi:hypothetical protein
LFEKAVRVWEPPNSTQPLLSGCRGYSRLHAANPYRFFGGGCNHKPSGVENRALGAEGGRLPYIYLTAKSKKASKIFTPYSPFFHSFFAFFAFAVHVFIEK